ncbi:MAG: lasso peptide biosynthesis B2 protein [Alphaproteobacteria bacterium]|nr:lasso peptide biosynthesis B2 protein [Alphaproteobacteria bacterium]MBU0796798.1 lasso peptide biosynthesis B2 protein [Alphaproteobacteria bacterium]MBU0885844.1 lasso peptide biosynthesis B2 protein [Alphaproteobacteria bacterium]MBU1812080.1 lasso peptide biosynthesis B2 protein [Alphaproteobacteria bacterium]MBU2089283.1 lasso peptide biosynthesis B2 protein [Alphaproteobacteria bacterium]
MKGLILRAETALALILALPLVYLRPLQRLAERLGGFSAPDDQAAAPTADLTRAQFIAARLNHIADRLPWTSSCLVRATAGLLLLARRRITGGRIRFGVRKHEGRLEAHAWLLLGKHILLGGIGDRDEANAFTPIADFSS